MKLKLISEGEHKDAFGTHKWKTYAQIPTNADRIRAMNDEELAEFLGKVTAGGYGMCAPGHYDCDGKDSCAPCWLEWLKQEADNGEN